MTSAYAKIIPFSEYLADPSVNNGWLKKMGKSAKAFEANTPMADTPALRIGRPIHTAILEPEHFFDAVTVWGGGMKADGVTPTTSKNSKAYKEFLLEAKNLGLEVIDPDEYHLCQDLAGVVSSHPLAKQYLSGGQAEQSIFWTHPVFGMKCKIRVDMLHSDKFVDLKSTVDVGLESFGRSANKYEYHVQGAFYQDGIQALTGKKLPFFIVAIEKVRPFDLVVYEVPDAALELGRSIYEDRLLKVKQCRESGYWPGVSEGLATLELPDYAFTQQLDAAVSWEGIEVIG